MSERYLYQGTKPLEMAGEAITGGRNLKEGDIANALDILIKGWLYGIPNDSADKLLHLQYILTVLSDEIDQWAQVLSDHCKDPN